MHRRADAIAEALLEALKAAEKAETAAAAKGNNDDDEGDEGGRAPWYAVRCGVDGLALLGCASDAVVAFLAATRQDIRNLRLPPTQSAAELEALRLQRASL